VSQVHIACLEIYAAFFFLNVTHLQCSCLLHTNIFPANCTTYSFDSSTRWSKYVETWKLCTAQLFGNKFVYTDTLAWRSVLRATSWGRAQFTRIYGVNNMKVTIRTLSIAIHFKIICSVTFLQGNKRKQTANLPAVHYHAWARFSPSDSDCHLLFQYYQTNQVVCRS